MNTEEFQQYLSLGHELSNVEFKPPFKYSDKEMLVRVVRCILGLANTRDGGILIIGIEEKGKDFIFSGLSDEQIGSLNYDDFSTFINLYADPFVEFNMEKIEYNNKKFLLLKVKEFSLIPVLCKKDFDNFLRAGACYVRTKKKPETTEIPSQTEMREILDLAISKGISKFYTQTRNAKLSLTGEIEKSPEELYNDQLIKVFDFKLKNKTNIISNKIFSRGHWAFLIKPIPFVKNRIPQILLLQGLIERTQDKSGGWDFPHIDVHQKCHIFDDWIELDFEWEHCLETWKFFQSGFFHGIFAFPFDWRDQSGIWPPTNGWEHSKSIEVDYIISSIYRFYQFAANLALEDEFVDEMCLEIRINNILGRRLISGFKNNLNVYYKSEIRDFFIPQNLSRDELISNIHNLTIDSSFEIFSRFGWNAPKESIQRVLSKIIE